MQRMCLIDFFASKYLLNRQLFETIYGFGKLGCICINSKHLNLLNRQILKRKVALKIFQIFKIDMKITL